MSIESAIRILAGSMVLLSVGLSTLIGPWSLLLAAFVGLNLIQSSFTGFCPAERVMQRLGIGAGTCGACSPSSAAPSSSGKR